MRRLSECDVWGAQRRYFDAMGPELWRRGVCPSYVTTNPFIAQTYAALASAFAADHPGEEPLWVLELGAGSGRFAHHFLHAVEGERPLRYVMTDVAPANVRGWQKHARLRAWVERGVLAFGVTDEDASMPIRSALSGEALPPPPHAPLVVIANYVFDGIEQDAFAMIGGRLHEVLVTSEGARGTDDAEWCSDLKLAWHPRPHDGDPYADPSWRAILDAYRSLPDGAFLFPTGALSWMARLRTLTLGPVLVLVADKGEWELPSLLGRGYPEVARHGSLSLPVNLHALAAWTTGHGGRVLAPPPAPLSIAVMGFLFDGAPHGATTRVWDDRVRRFGPDDFFALKRALERSADALPLEEILAFLRLASWDACVLAAFYDRLIDLVPVASPSQQRGLREGLLQAWERYLPLGEADDVAFSIGTLLAASGHDREAIPFFVASIASHGADEATVANLHRCHERAHA